MTKNEALEVLGIREPNPSDADIRRAYRALALKHHPDKEGGGVELFQKINLAYETLKNPQPQTPEIQAEPAFHGYENPYVGIFANLAKMMAEVAPQDSIFAKTVKNSDFAEIFKELDKELKSRPSSTNLFDAVYNKFK